MRRTAVLLALCGARFLCCGRGLREAFPWPEWKDLFNGKDLTGWVNVNTEPDTWKVKDGLLICIGHRSASCAPRSSTRTSSCTSSGCTWSRAATRASSSGATPCPTRKPPAERHGSADARTRLARICIKSKACTPPIAYVHGELFGVGGVETDPDNPRGTRSKSIENRCKGQGEWNIYDVVAVDGVVKLAVNGKFVNGVRRSTQKKGYLCLESEGAEIHFRNIRILELPPGVTTAVADGAGARRTGESV